jgi:hypothetical protein
MPGTQNQTPSGVKKKSSSRAAAKETTFLTRKPGGKNLAGFLLWRENLEKELFFSRENPKEKISPDYPFSFIEETCGCCLWGGQVLKLRESDGEPYGHGRLMESRSRESELVQAGLSSTSQDAGRGTTEAENRQERNTPF